MSCGRRSAPLNELRAAIGAERVSTDPAELIVYAYDGAWAEGRPAVVLHPETTRHVAEALRIANRERIPVVPRGAATGLAGGAVAVEGGWCLNLARMNKILDISAAHSVPLLPPRLLTPAPPPAPAEIAAAPAPTRPLLPAGGGAPPPPPTKPARHPPPSPGAGAHDA